MIFPRRVPARTFNSSAFISSLAVHRKFVRFFARASRHPDTSSEPFSSARRLRRPKFRKLAVGLRQTKFVVGTEPRRSLDVQR